MLRVGGATGGEESDVQIDIAGASTLLSDVTTDSIGTSASDVVVDLESAGVDTGASWLSVRLDFWQGASSTLAVEEVRFE